MLAFITSQQHQNTSGHGATRDEKIAASTGFCCISYYEFLIDLSTTEYFIYLPYIWNHRWPSSKCLNIIWRTIIVFDHFTRQAQQIHSLQAQNSLLQNQTFPWRLLCGCREKKSEHPLKFSRLYSESKVFFKGFFPNKNTHHSQNCIYAVYCLWKHRVCIFREGSNFKWQYSREGLGYC